MTQTKAKLNSFGKLLLHRFQADSPRPAIIYNSEKLTYPQLEEKVSAVTAFLRKQGMQKGDVVILYTPEKLPFLLIHLGILLGGGISLPLNPQFTGEEMVYFLNDSKARFVFAAQEQRAVIKGIKNRCPDLEKVFSTEIEKMVSQVNRGASTAIIEKYSHEEDYCFMLYSSGTTGKPKGVVHTHGNTAAAVLALQKCWEFSTKDVLLNVLPLYHIHGLSFAAHLSLVSGSTMIIEDRFHPLKTLDKIKEATVFMGIPTFYYSFLNRPQFREKAKEWKQTRLFTCGSAPIRPEVLGEIEEIIEKPLINRYGMTESHVITSLPLDGPFKHGSAGLPLEGVEIKLADIISDTPSKQNSPEELPAAEVLIKSRNLFHHYWQKPEATQEAFTVDGYFRTGDLGYFDEEGYLFLVGRAKDLIITSGFNVYPPVVERVINGFPGVKESAVIGVPDALKGEKVMAIIATEAGRGVEIEELKRYCRKNLVNYQCPVSFEILPELPRNTMGKVLKRQLREIF